MKVTRIASLIELLELTEPWNALTRGVPFRRCDWYAAWWRHYGRSAQLYVLCLHDEGRLIAVAPWYIESNGVKGRVVRFLASGEVCSDYQTVLCLPGREEEAAAAIADWLSKVKRNSASRTGVPLRLTTPSDTWDLLEFSGVEADDLAMRLLLLHLEQQGNQVEAKRGLNCWRLELPQTWEEYLARLSKSHRKQVRRLQRRVLETERAVWHTVQSQDGFPQAFNTLVDLHQRRWRSQGEPGVFASPRFTAFHQDIARQWLPQGRLRLHWLELDGKPAAAEYQFVADGIVYAYQGGVNPDLLSEDPGSLSNLAVIKSALDEGYQAIDFLRGDEPYKAHWRAVPRECRDIRVVPRRFASRLRYRAWTTGKRMKRWIVKNAWEEGRGIGRKRSQEVEKSGG